MFSTIEEQRHAFKSSFVEAPEKFRILHIGRFTNGETDVVACLYRALVNLGHAVLHLDTDSHEGVLHNPYGKVGGFGPIFVRLEAIRSIIREMDPHFIVLNAGGLCFSEADALELRKLGIPVVGITLSDPDVLPSVVGYAARFDYHTTNAEAALKMYEDAGIRNTFYMPFAIDRSYILRDIPSERRFDADVICIGHATARPERNQVMKALARSLDVKVYGRGWDFTEAVVVEGVSLLQASRGGRVHVNFPGTRAGYTNIKCGVFETVGSGRVLCTGEFEEMRNFFEYGTEIVPYNNPDELVKNIQDLLADPERYEGMRRRSFGRLLKEHLYEHRWLALFDKIKSDLHSASPIVGKERAAHYLSRLKGSGDYVRRVIISGFYGAHNVGDELILSSFRQGFRRGGLNMQAVVACEHPKNVERDHGVPAFRRSSLDEAEAAVKGASAVIVGGGGLWHDYTFEQAGGIAGFFTGPRLSVTGLSVVPLMANVLGKPVHVFGLGVGPLSHQDCKGFVRYASCLMDSITVRDAKSKDLLTSLEGWEAPVEVRPDAVYGYELPASFPEPKLPANFEGKSYLVVNLRPWDNEELDLEAYASILGPLCKRRNLAVVGVPMQRGSSMDEAVLRSLVELLPDDVPAHVVSLANLSAFDVLGLIEHSAGVLAMRLHMALLAHRIGRQVVGLAYDPKVRAHFEELGRADFVFPLTAGVEEVIGRLDKALDEPALDARVTERVRSLERDSAEAMDQLVARLGSAKVQRNPLSLGSHAGSRNFKVFLGSHDTDGSLDRRVRAQGVPFALGDAMVVSGSERDKKRKPPVAFEVKESKAMVKLKESAPRKGDFVSLIIGYAVRSGEQHVLTMRIQSPYQSKHAKRLEWTIKVNGAEVFKEDIAHEKAARKLEVHVTPNGTFVPVEITIRALKSCEDWGWGAASEVFVSDFRRRSLRAGVPDKPVKITVVE